MSAAEQLMDAVRSARGVAGADALCSMCVQVLDVDAAALSLVFDGLSAGTLGTSGDPAQTYDEVQFTLGQGPCIDAVSSRGPVMIEDLDGTAEVPWPAYGAVMLGHRIRGVFAFPVVVAGHYVAALDLFRAAPGPLSEQDLGSALVAAQLAAMPVLDMTLRELDGALDPESPQWDELHALSRVEVAQATGMLVAQLGVEPAHALARLRAHAFATGRSTTAVARDVLERSLRLERDEPDGVGEPDGFERQP